MTRKLNAASGNGLVATGATVSMPAIVAKSAESHRDLASTNAQRSVWMMWRGPGRDDAEHFSNNVYRSYKNGGTLRQTDGLVNQGRASTSADMLDDSAHFVTDATQLFYSVCIP
jgi:hypothetical protein